MAEWTTEDLRTQELSNQKNIYVGTAAPGTAYDGQVWVCTSSDPPLVKVYDNTNSQWMEHHQVFYETVLSGQMPATTPILNGAVAVTYDTEQSSTTLYARANGSWRDMGGALTRVYPVGDVVSGGSPNPSTDDLAAADTTANLNSGDTVTLHTIYITPTNSGDTICVFGGMGAMGEFGDDDTGRLRATLVVGATEIDAYTFGNNTQAHVLLNGYVNNVANISAGVYVSVERLERSGTCIYTGPIISAISVKT